MPQWEYRKINLCSHRPKEDDLDLLDAAGKDGWELLAVTANNIAYLKRAVVVRTSRQTTAASQRKTDVHGGA